MEDFVNLRVHSSYSIKDGLLSPYQIVDIAAKNGEKAVAITDLNYMLKTVDFYEYARKKGVKPIVGVDAYIERDVFNSDEFEDNDSIYPTRMVFLAKNEEGFKKISAMLSRSILENQKEELKIYDGVGFIKQSWLTKDFGKDVVLLSGESTTSDITKEALYGDPDIALEKVNYYKNIFGNNFFLEINRIDQKDERDSILKIIDLSIKSGVPIVATNPIQFENRQDYYFHELRSCISSKEEIYDISRELKFTREQYYKSREEINELFKDIPSAISMSSKIADMCNVKLQLNISELPSFDTDEGESEEDYLIKKSKQGLKERLIDFFPDEAERESVRKTYEDRLDFELSVINRMGFSGYFLIVQDYIGWAKDNGVMVGPGRGSGAGSLVAYSLGITNLNPLPYNLLFERFLNPERVSMPDFDVDFDERGLVIDYMHNKYDKENEGLSVSQIATYGLLKVKAVIKSAARVLGVPYPVVDQISKKIPNDPKLKLSDILNQEWLLKQMEESSAIRDLIEAAKKLENIPTSVGVHAGGVVVGKKQLTDYSPLAKADNYGVVFSQYDKYEVEKAGLVKFDFLGLSNLSVLSKTISQVNNRAEFKEKPFNIDKIPLDDPEIYKLFKEANTGAVFQFEGQGMRNTLKLTKPDRFEDLIAIVSLFRPGPMEHIGDYAKNKSGAEIKYLHPLLEDILKETYGIMIYQEQVMQTAQKVAGYTLGQADMLRRAMGGKKASEMEKQREVFREGAKKNGLTEKNADDIFNLMEKFAGYGFNKSHAAAYSLISYQTAYMKKYYAPEYYSSFLNVESMVKASKNSNKVEFLLNDARMNGLSILPPDINKCDATFTYEGNNIRYGLSGIKGVTPSSIENIKKDINENGEYKSFEDFYSRIGVKTKKTVIENLVFAGVFDNIEPNRTKIFYSLPEFMNYKKDVTDNNKKIADNEKIEEENSFIENNIQTINEINDVIGVIAKRRRKLNSDLKKIAGEEIPDDYQKEIKEIQIQEENISKEIIKLYPDYTIPDKGVKLIKPRSLKKLKEMSCPTLIDEVESWSEVTKFNYEKAVYGFYLTGHPYNYYNNEMSGFKASLPLEEINLITPPKEGEVQLISGIIHSIEKKRTRTGTPMWIISLSDGKETISMFAFDYITSDPEKSEKIKVGEFVSMQVKIKPPIGDSSKNLLGIEDIFNFTEIKNKLIKGVNVALSSKDNTKLIDIINKHRGNMKVTIYNPEASTGNYAVADLDDKKFGINGSPECIKELSDTFGNNNVVLKLYEKMLFSNSYKYKLKR